MDGLSFIKQYRSTPGAVGAVLPSSKYLADKMIHNIGFDNAQCIVEYGPGTGVITDEILKHRKPDTVVLLFENNVEFYKLLSEKYSDEVNLHIVNDSAEHIGKYLQQYNIECADYIISGLPFTSLPKKVSLEILAQTKKYLKPGGSFTTFQYTMLKRDFIGQFFDSITIERELRNIPPAYVLCCSNHMAE
ncbi:MAG: methyltransferase [Defluviitaleaceae bacterium]|nr:methyltransferase [Defluviitaleaceae bacterium]